MDKIDIKKAGAYFTPPELAGFVANSIINMPECIILDPCYGHGSLLWAAHNRLAYLGCRDPKTHLFGCDLLDPPAEVSQAIHSFADCHNLITSDFFKLPTSKLPHKFDTIIMNPPFIRHHMLTAETKKVLNQVVEGISGFPHTADLWAYFLVKSLDYLRFGGSLAAILPWSFLYADYSRPIRKYLNTKFGPIKILSIGQRLFDSVQERIVILLCSDFGATASSIQIAYSAEIPTKDIDWSPLEALAGSNSSDNEVSSIHERNHLRELSTRVRFRPLNDFADVRIGNVTGANDFFIVDSDKGNAVQVPNEWLTPVIARAGQIADYASVSKSDAKDSILTIPAEAELSEKVRSYLKSGEEKGYDKRYHCKNRIKWYSINLKPAPDSFLPYMIKEIPTIVLNPDKIRNTNNIHGVYLRNGYGDRTLKWIQLSMLTSLSQLSVEVFSRTYKSGVLKIEPSAAKQILVFDGKGHDYPDELANTVSKLIINGKREQTMNLVDEWFVKSGIFSWEDVDNTFCLYQRLRSIRLGIDKRCDHEIISSSCLRENNA